MRNKKKNLNLVRKMAESIKENILNRSIYDYICQCLDNSLEDNYQVINESQSSVTIKEKKTKNSANISFTPSIESITSISINEVIWNGACEKQTIVEFIDNFILVTKIEVIKYTSTNKKECSAVRKRIIKQTYIDNELRYSYELNGYTPFSITDTQAEAKLSELYIDENSHAVRREIVIRENDELFSNKVNYSYTDYCDEPPFNDRVNNKGIYKYGMSPVTHEVYDEFVKNQKDILKKKLEK